MPRARRILSLWLPRFAAEWRAKREGFAMGADAPPFAVVGERRGALEIISLTATAETPGAARGMGLTDARAMTPDLITRPETA